MNLAFLKRPSVAAAMDMAQALTECGAVRFGEFTLTSGQKSRYYVDVKAAMTNPGTLRMIGKAFAKVASEKGPFDAVAGMELGAVPLATAVSLEATLPLLIVRKSARTHGTGKRIEAPANWDMHGKRVFVVEDVTTSGGSTAEAVEVLRAAGAIVTPAAVVVDRESGGVEKLASVGVELSPLTKVSQLLDTPQAREAMA